jgi:predicted nucleic acid-binding protein
VTLLFDTSVVIAALSRPHARHAVARPWMDAVVDGRVGLVLSAHSIGELYAYFTAVREIAMPPGDAARMIRTDVVDRARVRTLPALSYVRLLGKLGGLDIRGGAVYDAIHAEVARREDVDGILTINTKHFLRVWPDDTDRIIDPRTTPPPTSPQRS